jgi:hypothetical protein
MSNDAKLQEVNKNGCWKKKSRLKEEINHQSILSNEISLVFILTSNKNTWTILSKIIKKME